VSSYARPEEWEQWAVCRDDKGFLKELKGFSHWNGHDERTWRLCHWRGQARE